MKYLFGFVVHSFAKRIAWRFCYCWLGLFQTLSKSGSVITSENKRGLGEGEFIFLLLSFLALVFPLAYKYSRLYWLLAAWRRRLAKRPLRWRKRGARRYLKLSIIVLVGTSLCPNQGRIQDFFRRRCTRLLLYFNTNKPHSFFFAKYQLGGGGCATPAPSP